MIWTKRLLLASPFVVAVALTVLMIVVDRFHLRSEHIAGFAFLFGAPWAWLLDHDWFGNLSQPLGRVAHHLRRDFVDSCAPLFSLSLADTARSWIQDSSW